MVWRGRRAVWLGAGAAVAASWGAPAHAHPKLGAHADVRVAVERDGVRLHLIMNLGFVDGLVQVPRRDLAEVAPDEEAATRRALELYFGAGGAPDARRAVAVERPNVLEIDGIEVAPVVRSFEVIRPQVEMKPGFDPDPALLIPQVAMVLDFEAKTAPRRVRIAWGTFPRDFTAADRLTPPWVNVEAQLTGEGDVQIVTFSREEPEFTWHAPSAPRAERFIAVPEARQGSGGGSGGLGVVWIVGGAACLGAGVVVRRRRGWRAALGGAGVVLAGWGGWQLMRREAGAAGAPAVSVEEAAEIFRALHANIYRAFDYTSEDDIYDALARSVDGPMLDALYGQIYRSLVMYDEGGAVSRVKRVMPLSGGCEGEVTGEGFTYRARWQVEGSVYHWGHAHTRTNEYLGDYDLALRPEGWRIVGHTVLEQFRVDAEGRASAQEPQQTVGEVWKPER